ncbi:MAG: hypothetical protein WBQ75_10975 [Acetobacteraceae bacterium]
MLLPLITKARDWAYEDEYRLIAQEAAVASNHESLITRNNLLQLPSGALISIIIGCVAPQSTRDTITDIVKRSGQNIQLKRMVRVPNRYELAIENLA